MCSRHAEMGAGMPDSMIDELSSDGAQEWTPNWDWCCDYCGKLNGPLRSVKIGNSTSFMCEPCHDRQQAHYAEMIG